MKKILSLILLALFFAMQNGIVFALSLPADTPVVVEASETYGSDTLTSGGDITFVVANDITSDMGKVLIKKGTLVNGKAVNVKSRGRIGKPGKIEMGEFYTTATNGAKVSLKGAVLSRAKSKMALSITLSVVIIPFFLLMKGKDTQIPQGAQYTLYTAVNTNI